MSQNDPKHSTPASTDTPPEPNQACPFGIPAAMLARMSAEDVRAWARGDHPSGDGVDLPPDEPFPQPDAELEAAFRATCFEVLEAPQATLNVGQDPAAVRDWLDRAGANQACIITAWNPVSTPTDLADNLREQLRLIEWIRAIGLSFLSAQGRDPTGTWPPEPSVCVLDAHLADIDQWLLEFRQFAAVVLTPTEGCQLRWHPEVKHLPSASA
jgi:hypothetical protein